MNQVVSLTVYSCCKTQNQNENMKFQYKKPRFLAMCKLHSDYKKNALVREKYFRIKYCRPSYDTSDTYNEKSNTSNFITPTAALIHISRVLRAPWLHPLSEPLPWDSADAVKVTKVITKHLEQSFFTVPPPALFVLGSLLSVISHFALRVRYDAPLLIVF